MDFNLIRDPWIPVMRNGRLEHIRPWQVAEAGISSLAWPRADLNIACLELLVGMIYMADPPSSRKDWRERMEGDPERLRKALEKYADAFHFVGGNSGHFMQDYEEFEADVLPAGALFLDAPGKSTLEQNKDVIVHRDKLSKLDLPTAAMALYARQSYAGGGGTGYRSGLRGGGPIVNLVQPRNAEKPLWATLWANVPEGNPLDDVMRLPWMKPTILSDMENAPTIDQPKMNHLPAEVYFGMPSRIRVDFEDGHVVGMRLKGNGNNYGGWVHPNTPYRRSKPEHPLKPVGTGEIGPGYKDYAGIVFQAPVAQRNLQQRASCVSTYLRRAEWEEADILVAGWAVSNATGEEFMWSQEPIFPDTPEVQDAAGMMSLAAEKVSKSLAISLSKCLMAKATSPAVQAHVASFYHATKPAFLRSLKQLARGTKSEEEVLHAWRDTIDRSAFKIFDDTLLQGLTSLDVVKEDGASKFPTVKKVVAQRKTLLNVVNGKPIYSALGIEKPKKASTNKESNK